MKMWLGKSDKQICGKTRAISLLATIALSLCASAQNVNVTAEDPRIDYVGNWVLQDGGGHKFVNTPGSYLTFTFQGSHLCLNVLSQITFTFDITLQAVQSSGTVRRHPMVVLQVC